MRPSPSSGRGACIIGNRIAPTTTPLLKKGRNSFWGTFDGVNRKGLEITTADVEKKGYEEVNYIAGIRHGSEMNFQFR